MKLHVEWIRPYQLRLAKKSENLIYNLDLKKVTNGSGLYIFGRRWGSQFEALYVGKAGNIRSRIRGHLNNLSLMKHIENAKTGKRIVLAGRMMTKRGQQMGKCLKLVERALIRYFMSEGHDLVNKQGTRLSRHEVFSDGSHPKRYFSRVMYVEKAKGE